MKLQVVGVSAGDSRRALETEGSGGKEKYSAREERWRAYLELIRAGSAESLAGLYDDTVPILYGLALRILGNAADAEEVVLDVFQQVWRTAGGFDPGRSSVWRWLEVLTRSRSIDRLRVAGPRRRREQSVDEIWHAASSERPPDQVSMFRQQQELVRGALKELPPEQREVIELAYFSELTHVEIAEGLKLPLGTIKTRIRMGMKKLRESLGALAVVQSGK